MNFINFSCLTILKTISATLFTCFWNESVLSGGKILLDIFFAYTGPAKLNVRFGNPKKINYLNRLCCKYYLDFR